MTNSAGEASIALEVRKVDYVLGGGEGQTLSAPVAPGLKAAQATLCVLELVPQSERCLAQNNTGAARAFWDWGVGGVEPIVPKGPLEARGGLPQLEVSLKSLVCHGHQEQRGSVVIVLWQSCHSQGQDEDRGAWSPEVRLSSIGHLQETRCYSIGQREQQHL